MARNATLSLEGFDPEVIEAAREVAQRAGVPLETWIASVVSPEAQPAKSALAKPRTRAVAREAAAPQTAAPAPAGPAPTAAPVASEPSPIKGSSTITPPKARVVKATPVETNAPAAAAPTRNQPADEQGAVTIAAMMRRLDALDRSLKEDRGAQAAPAPAEPRTDHVAERLAEIERRMGDISAQMTAPRPLGRSGRPIAAEMRDAVDAVRRRQRELDAAGLGEAPAFRATAEAAAPSPAIAELQAETARLRESLGGLATGRDLGALEKAMRSLAKDVQRSRDPAELAAPIDAMRRQVETLAQEFADNVHTRLAGEVERLSRRADGSLALEAASHADHAALDGVHGELDEIRQMIAGLAGPERIQSLAEGVEGLSGQIAELQERVDGHPVRELIERLDSLGETMHRPAAASAEIASMHALLRGLADKVERVGSGSGNLDALENQVVSIARRLDTRPAVDPAMAGLERTMGELLNQVVAMRDESSVEAAVERATRRAFAESMGADDHAPAHGRIDAFRADLDDLRNRQIAADQRMQSTMDNLNTVLSRLVDRLGMPEAAGPVIRAAMPDQGAPLGESLRASTTLGTAKGSPAKATPSMPDTIPVSAPRSRVVRRPEPSIEESGIGDELLEPGTARPVPGRSASSDAAPTGDIKTSFIAAARRAAQAAQADMAAEAPAAPEQRDAPRARIGNPAPAAATPGLVGRLLGGLDKRRRPLILALAAVVLVIGAYQAFEPLFSSGNDAQPAGQPVAAVAPAPTKPAAVEPPAAEARVAPAEPAASAPAPGPQTTQSIADAGTANAKPPAATRADDASAATAQPVIPKVASMASLGRELATVPSGLATLKQSALDGNGAAIYELAAREADGRGMPRDLAVAAKLYEKLADAGYAPAQFKLGSFYEKGSGVIRDIGQAKTWYGRAADRGNVRAMHNLAVLFAENPSASGKPDFATASSWFRKAAEYGVRDSQYNLAVLYARGLGVGQDLIQSYAWFSAAAAQGDEESGKKRDDVAAKLSAKDLASAKAIAAAFKAKVGDPSANDMPPPKPAAPAAMSLLTAPPPGTPTGSFVHTGPRTGV